jgi:hypothetical protein
VLEEDTIERLRWSARNYVENWQRFAKGMRRID